MHNDVRPQFKALTSRTHALIMLVVLWVCSGAAHAQPVLQKLQAVTDQVTALSKNKQYDDAIALGESWRKRYVQAKELSTTPSGALFLISLSQAYSALAQYDKAVPLELHALEIWEKEFGPNHPSIANNLDSLALAYSLLHQYGKALPLQLRSLSIREKNQGFTHPDTVQVLSSLAMTYSFLHQFERALPLQLRVLAAREQADELSQLDTALALSDLAFTYSELNQWENALSVQLRELAIYETEYGPFDVNTARSLNKLAGIYLVMAQHIKAVPLVLRAVAIQENILGPAHPETLHTLNTLAFTYMFLGQYAEALPLQKRILNIRENISGAESEATTNSVNALAETYEELSRYDEALSLRIRAQKANENTFGGTHTKTAASLLALARTYSRLDRYDMALPLQLRAVDIFKKSLGREHSKTVSALGQLANSYAYLAQHDKALAARLLALDADEKTWGPAHLITARRLSDLGGTYRSLGRAEEALPLELRALAITERVKGPAHPHTGASLNNLALTYSQLGQHDKATPLFQRGLAISEKVYGEEHPSTANGLESLAGNFSSLALYNDALPLQVRALEIYEKVLGSEHTKTAWGWSNLSVIFEGMGQPTLAISLLKQAVNIYQTQRERVSTIGKGELQSYSASVEVNYQTLASWLTDQGRLAEAQQVLDMLKEDEQFDFIRRSSTADPRRTRMGYTPSEAKWMTRFRQVADQLGALGAEEQALQKQAKLGLTPAQQARLKAIKDDLAVANKAFTSFLEEMQKGFAAEGPAKAAEVEETSAQAQRELQSLVRQLGPDVALMQYYVTPDKVGIILTTPGVVLPFSSVVDAKALNRQIFQYRNMLGNRTSNPLPASQALYQLLVAPVAQALEQAGIKTVMLSLDGNLRHVPFGALHDGKQYLAQRWSLPLYTAVTKDKLRDAVSPRWKTAGLGVTRALGEFKALPAVKRELDDVLRATASGGVPGEVYLDEQFTASRLKDVGQRSVQLMHVSSHFQLSPGTEVNSFLLLGDGQRLTLGDMRTQNYRFDQVDLLTLSACDTGLGGGRDANGKEIEGLGVIAQQQGAKAVLATLWPVADQSTATLMADMYQRRQTQTLSKIEALRQAQLALMAQPKYAHPFYWAPFILMGNWK
jgi:CHAT domain-containing protein